MQRRIPPHPSSLFGRGHGHDFQVLETLVAVAGLGLGSLWLRFHVVGIRRLIEAGLGLGRLWLRVMMGIRRLSELGVVGAAALRLFLEQAHHCLFQVMKLGLDHEGPCHRRAYERHQGCVWVSAIAEVYARGRQRMMWSERWAEACSGVRRVVEALV
jgi:hypothetical protein